MVAELEAALEYERVRREKLEAQLDACRDGMDRLNSSKSYASGYKLLALFKLQHLYNYNNYNYLYRNPFYKTTLQLRGFKL